MKNYIRLSNQALIDLLSKMQINLPHNPSLCIHKSFTNDKFISMLCCIYHNGNCYECLRHYLQEEGNQMRYIDGVESIEEISLLLKYLYLSEDHKITITNTIGIKMEIRMNNDFTLIKKMINGICPGEEMSCTADFTVPFLRDVVAYLKHEKPETFTDVFKSRWDEIAEITKSNLALNYNRQNRINHKD